MSTPERAGVHTLDGKPLTLIGPELRIGDRAPDFTLMNRSFETIDLAATGDRVRLFSVVPSLDTSVCAAQTRRFDEEAAKLGGEIGFYTVSRDLPYAATRFCEGAMIERITTLSDHVDGNFGRSYGVYIKEFGVLSRSVFVLDAGAILRHVEYVAEFGHQPDYDTALQVLRSLVRT